MANRTDLTTIAGPSTKIRAEQIKSELELGTLAGDIQALTEQLGSVIGAEWKEEEASFEKVQLLDLAAHVEADHATDLKILQNMVVTGSVKIDGDKAATVGAMYLVGAAHEIAETESVVFAGGELGVTGDVRVSADIYAVNATLTGDLSAVNATFTGDVSAVDATLSGDINAANATLSGDLAAVNATLSGNLSAVDATLSGDLAAVDATLSGNLSAVGGTFSANISAVDATLSGDLAAVDATLSGNLSAVGGTFSANISAVDATLSGDLAAVDATLSGNLSAVGGTFSANISAVDATLSGDLSAVDGTFSGDISAVGLTLTGNVTAVDATFSGNATIDGNLTVNGTMTYVDSTTVQIGDISLELGVVDGVAAGDLASISGGGLELKSTGGDKTLLWTTANAWSFNDSLKVTGDLTVTGDASAVNATLSGDLSAVDGTFSGDVAAVNGTFSADISAVDATLSGDLSAVNGTFSADISAVDAALSGDATIGGTLSVTGKTDFAGIVDIATTLSASEIKIDLDVAQRLYIVGSAGEIKDEEKMTFNGSMLAVQGEISGSSKVSGEQFYTKGLADMGKLIVQGSSQFMNQIKIEAAAQVSGSVVPSVGMAFNLGDGMKRYQNVFAGQFNAGGQGVQLAGSGDQYVMKGGPNGNLIMSQSLAGAYIRFDDAFRGATVLSGSTPGLKLANSGEWAAFAADPHFSSIDSILGAFKAVGAALTDLEAGGGAEKIVVDMTAVAADVNAWSQVSAAWSAFSVALNEDNSMFFFNGQLLRSGSAAEVTAASRDYYTDGSATLKFAFAVEAGDVLAIQKI